MNQNFVTEIDIEHVRHLHNIVIPLSHKECRHLILTGKNGSGKTSVMDALAAFCSLYASSNNDYNAFISDQKELLSLQEHIQTLAPNSPEYLQVSERMNLVQEYIHHYDQGAKAIFRDAEKVRVEAFQGKYIFAYYRAEREYQAKNETEIAKVELKDAYQMNEHPGQKFVQYMLSLKSTGAMAEVGGKKARAEEIKAWFKRFDEVLKLIFDDQSAHLDFDIETFAFHIVIAGREPFTFDTLSSGYAAVLDIVVDLMMRMEKKAGRHYDLEGLVLIDEIETHLHLALQRKILPILTKLFPNIQFIITTHSPFILNSIENAVIYDLENSTLVNRSEGLSDVPYDGIVEGYFQAPVLSEQLQKKYEAYKKLAQKKELTDDDYEKIAELEYYLDEIPDYLGLGFMADYKRLKLELAQRG